MRKYNLFQRISTITPLLLFTLILSGLLLIRMATEVTLFAWGAWLIGICWGLMAVGFMVRAELFKQIGGFVVVSLAALILIGSLGPKENVARYPHVAADQMAHNIETTWNTVYTGNLFENFSLQQKLIEYGHSFGNLDPFTHGKMILYAMLEFMLALCYLFPIEPWERTGWRISPAYVCRAGLLMFVGVVFALQVELLQVLSPTREVSGAGLLNSWVGLLVGLLIFIPLHGGYLLLAEYRRKGTRRFNVLGVGVDAVNMDDCLKLFQKFIEQGVEDRGQGEQEARDVNQVSTLTALPAMTSALGVAGIVEARRNSKLQCILNRSVLNTPDGMPLVWLGKLFGYRNIERVYGPDLLRDVCAYSESRGWRHFFYGAAPGIVEELKKKLEEKQPAIQISGIYCPPFRDLTKKEEEDVVYMVNSSGTDIFWIGISTPKQLYFMDYIRSKLHCKIICPVGYAFDVNAGVQEDAPDWAKYSGFQWLHRAIKQPRLWKRYLPDNPRFVLEVILQVLHLKKYPMLTFEKQPACDKSDYVKSDHELPS